jgi:hypothetical protein
MKYPWEAKPQAQATSFPERSVSVSSSAARSRRRPRMYEVRETPRIPLKRWER